MGYNPIVVELRLQPFTEKQKLLSPLRIIYFNVIVNKYKDVKSAGALQPLKYLFGAVFYVVTAYFS